MVQQISETSETTIGVKEAIRIARDHLRYIFADEGRPLENLLLEEVELSDDRRNWLITFGFDGPRPERRSTFEALQSMRDPERKERIYKIVTINASTSQFESMKIREV
ncbi:MAG: hypothetical protein H7175_11525 [Burkholderiales bacterium]|nr:hypothetical protein [Anaerolineae bacterium]